MNFFQSASYCIQKSELQDLTVIKNYMKIGMEQVHSRLNQTLNGLIRKKDYIVVETPVQWAQNLHNLFIEVRYAHRHDAPGCSNSDDEQVEIKEDSISLQVLCLEQASKIKYKIKIHLWDKIDVNQSRHEYQTVGKHSFILQKLRAPARWKTLYSGGLENKPFNIRLWLTQHEKYIQSLWEFEGDAINDFEGYQQMEEQDELYEEYLHKKKLSKKGPIPLERKKKKRNQKKKLQKGENQ